MMAESPTPKTSLNNNSEDNGYHPCGSGLITMGEKTIYLITKYWYQRIFKYPT